ENLPSKFLGPIPRITASHNPSPSSSTQQCKTKASSKNSSDTSVNIPSKHHLSEDSHNSKFPVKFKLIFSEFPTREPTPKRRRLTQSKAPIQPEILECIEVRLDFENVAPLLRPC